LTIPKTRLFTVNAQEEFDLVDRLDDIIGDFRRADDRVGDLSARRSAGAG